MGCACVLMVGASELAARMADDRRDSLDPRADAPPQRATLDWEEPDVSEQDQPNPA
jgi:hypothetical protein